MSHQDKNNEILKEENENKDVENKDEIFYEYKALKEENEKLKEKIQQLEENNNKSLRTAAQIQNLFNDFKDQTKKDIERTIKKERKDILSLVINIREMLAFAINAVKLQKEKGENAIDNLLLGIERLDQYILSCFLKYDFKEIICTVGEEFDYNIQEAKQMIPTDDENLNNKIANVVSVGYQLKDEIIKNPVVDVYKYLSKQ